MVGVICVAVSGLTIFGSANVLRGHRRTPHHVCGTRVRRRCAIASDDDARLRALEFRVGGGHIHCLVNPVPERVALKRVHGDDGNSLLDAHSSIDGGFGLGNQCLQVADREVEDGNTLGCVMAWQWLCLGFSFP